MSLDHLSDDILIDILSRLSLKEAGRTSVLNRRFQHLWRSSKKIETLTDDRFLVHPDFFFPRPPSSFFRRLTVRQYLEDAIEALFLSDLILQRGRHLGNTLPQHLSVLSLWRVRGIGLILHITCPTLSRLVVEEIPKMEMMNLNLPSISSLAYAGRMLVMIRFSPNPFPELLSASLDFRRSFEEKGSVVARIATGGFANLLRPFMHTRTLSISTHISGELMVCLSNPIALDVRNLILEMNYCHDFDSVLSILSKCGHLHSLTIRWLDPAPFPVEVILGDCFIMPPAAVFTTPLGAQGAPEAPEAPEAPGAPVYTESLQHLTFEGVRGNTQVFGHVSYLLEVVLKLHTLTLSSYHEDQLISLYDWVGIWMAEYHDVQMRVR